MVFYSQLIPILIECSRVFLWIAIFICETVEGWADAVTKPEAVHIRSPSKAQPKPIWSCYVTAASNIFSAMGGLTSPHSLRRLPSRHRKEAQPPSP